MTHRLPTLAFLTLLAASCTARQATAPAPRFAVPASPEARWYKGNTHTHTTESDGDSPPEVVARWYKDHGYDFLVLSDHNVFTDPATLARLVDSTFLLVPGEELSASFEKRPVHVNGLNVPGVVAPRTAETMVGTIQANVDAVREVAGVPHINHPNFRWAFGAAELGQVERDRLLEIFNGHPLVHNEGGGETPGIEAVWDTLLTRGKRIYGIATDDAHHFQGEFAPDRANPGRGWVVVKAEALEARALMEALEAGRFYASTGVALTDVRLAPDRLEIHIAPEGDYRYTTVFIGAGGRELARTGANPAIYELQGEVGYVRARVTDSGGRHAWTQPVFTTSR
ncbi:MAG: PHP domain-containing protein [Gemmatimonadetes bacterium]|nr:PHP domain-containing protein [Gemmatimonadota bacterium]